MKAFGNHHPFVWLYARRFALIVALVFIFAGGALQAAPPGKSHRQDRIIVQWKEGQDAQAFSKKFKPGRNVKNARKQPRLHAIELAPGETMEAALKEFQSDLRIEFAEPDYFYAPSLLPNDPSMTNGALWGLRNIGQSSGKADADIDATEAWNTVRSASNIVVAVVDSGIRYTHEDLAGNMWRNPGEVLNGRDDDGNGLIDDIHGYNAFAGSGDPMDQDGHGTHVAGTIGAVGNMAKAWRECAGTSS